MAPNSYLPYLRDALTQLGINTSSEERRRLLLDVVKGGTIAGAIERDLIDPYLTD